MNYKPKTRRHLFHFMEGGGSNEKQAVHTEEALNPKTWTPTPYS